MTEKTRILIVGDSGVGKTNFIKYLSDKSFECVFKPTMIIKKYETDNLILYDYPGQNKYNINLTQEIDLFIIMYDVTNNLSYKSVKFWKQKKEQFYNYDIPVIVIGNKIDSEYRRNYRDDTINISVKQKLNINNVINQITISG
jgi:small GTP-binding protein